jgi:hypothetical protein
MTAALNEEHLVIFRNPEELSKVLLRRV